MTKKDDGGPAFPESCTSEGFRGNISPGMTLRDYFAAQCMPAIIMADGAQYFDKYERHAGWAYEMADALIAERAK